MRWEGLTGRSISYIGHGGELNGFEWPGSTMLFRLQVFQIFFFFQFFQGPNSTLGVEVVSNVGLDISGGAMRSMPLAGCVGTSGVGFTGRERRVQ